MRQARAGDNAGKEARRIGSAAPVGGMKAEETQNAQVILSNAPCRIADEADAARIEIGKPADIIVDGAIAGSREGIHGEVASLGVRPPVTAEPDNGFPYKGLDVLAQGRHLD